MQQLTTKRFLHSAACDYFTRTDIWVMTGHTLGAYHNDAVRILNQVITVEEDQEDYADIFYNKISGKYYAVLFDGHFDSPVDRAWYVEVYEEELEEIFARQKQVEAYEKAESNEFMLSLSIAAILLLVFYLWLF